jgi:hypothetical protein
MQAHPLYAQDRALLDQALATATPGPAELTLLARLRLRYGDFDGCPDIPADIQAAMDRWDLTVLALNKAARKVWQSGWRPGSLAAEAVGSGADVEAG